MSLNARGKALGAFFFLTFLFASGMHTGDALAQRKTHTIAMVLSREEQNIEASFRDYLAKRLLLVKFENVHYSDRPEDGPALIEAVRALKPDLIYSWSTSTTLALAGKDNLVDAATHIRDIPIVFTEVTDPVGSGLLRQLDPPNRNLTGVSHVAPLTVQLKAMSSYRPFKRLGYITNPAESNTLGIAQVLKRMAPEMGFDLLEETVPLNEDGEANFNALPGLVARLAERKADLLYIGPSSFLAFTHRDLVTNAALRVRLPTFCATESVVRQSQCMFGLFANGANVGRFAAYKASQILIDHVPVETIPAQSLQRFSLLINMPIVKKLEFYPPLTLLSVAEVIE
ncbi:ABC transporter substrate-binding protein [Ottowia thiooxydans]|uniref:ABC transporter substrate-binding protein n=1 Tax=Ottowia thiooxydans TaxID=219182 RepID=UPI00040200A8|nr:ABC transporter substrate-binding protein [Ottowia thiooxydans]